MSSGFASHTGALMRLRMLWWWFLLTECAIVAICYGFLSSKTDLFKGLPIGAERWLSFALAVLGVELWLVRRNLPQNHRHGESTVLPTLGMGNVLTLVRGLAYALMAGFLLAPRPGGWLDWAPAILYSLACLADFFDGYVARITNHATVLGEVLDMEFDGLGMLIGLALAVQYGQLPAIYLLIALGRPLFVLGLRLRQQMGLPEYPMTPSSNRRIIAGVHMGFLMILLWPVFTPPLTYIAGATFGIPIVLSFLRDWLVVIGWIDPASPGYRRLHRLGTLAVFAWLPLFLRLLSALLTGWLLWRAGVDPWPWQSLLAVFGGARPFVVATLFTLGGVAALAAAPGIMTRLAAIGLVAVACVDFLARGVLVDNALLLAAASLLLLVGSGRGALWTPEEYLFHTRTGTPKQQTQ